MILYLFDKTLTLIDALQNEQMLSCIMRRQINYPERLFASVPADLYPVIESAEFAGHYFNNRFYIHKLQRKQLRNYWLEIEGISYAYDELAHQSIIKEKQPNNTTAEAALLSALEGTGWVVGQAENTDPASASFYYITPLAAINKIIETWHVEPELYYEFDGYAVTGRRIDLYKRRGSVTGERYVWGSDILNVVQESDTAHVITALYGRGKGEEILDELGNPTGNYSRRLTFADVEWSIANGDPLDKPLGQEYLEIPSATQEYGYPRNGVMHPRFSVELFENITDANELINKTYELLISQARKLVTFEATVAQAGPYVLGDSNYIVMPHLGFVYEARIFADEVNLLNPDLTRFEFGDYIEPARVKREREVRQQLEYLNSRAPAWDANADVDYESYLDQVLTKLNEQANATGGWVWIRDGEGLLSMDNPNQALATGAVQIIGGTLRLASAKLPDGSWNWRTLIQGGKLFADLITAGILQGGKVRFNLETGSFLIGNSTTDYHFYWDGTALHINGASINLSTNPMVVDLHDAIESNTGLINTVSNEMSNQTDALRDDIAADYTPRTEFNSYKANVNTQFQQTSQGFNFQFNQILADIEGMDTGTQAEFEEIRKYIRFLNGKIILGQTTSPLSVEISNSRISFMQGGAEVAYISNNILYILDGRFLNSLRIGNFSFRPRSNGSLSFGKVV